MLRLLAYLLLCLSFTAGEEPVPPSARNDYYEPLELWAYCHCELKGGFGDLNPVRVSTFDVDDNTDSGSVDLLAIRKEQKTLVSRWTKNPGTKPDPCEYQLRVVTQQEAAFEDKPNPGASLYIEWLGFGFDDHEKRQLERNVVSGQNITHVAKRGRGFSGPKIHEMPFDYYNVTTGVDLHVSASHDKTFIKFRSKSCAFALDFYPDGRNTRLDFFVGDHYKNNDEGGGNFEGICGNCNDLISDDKEKCTEVDNKPRDVFDSVVWEEQKEEISDSCEEGPHQGHKYLGGAKLETMDKP